MKDTPKYHLADVPHDLRTTVLDRCCRRLYRDALELLQQHGFHHYTVDDLVNFYHWAPATLQPHTDEPDRSPQRPRDYSQPSAEQLDDIRGRLAGLPPGESDRLHELLVNGPLEPAASLLWKAGVFLTSAELYEYRKTLFPPNSMVDAYTADAPVLRKPAHDLEGRVTASPTSDPAHRGTDSLSAPVPTTPGTTGDSPPPILMKCEISDSKLLELGASLNPPSLDPEPSTPEATDNNQPSTGQIEPLAPSTPASGVPLPVPRKRRGKIASLPKDLREELNTRLEANQSYTTIMRWLARNGHAGFNKQNLHKWKEGGYQDWRRENERLQIQLLQREWLYEQVAQTKPGELFPLIDHLFVTQVLETLFGLDTATMKKGLAAGPRHFISLFSAYNRFKRDAMNSEKFHAFLQQEKQEDSKRAPTTRELYESVGLRPPQPHSSQTVKDRQPSSNIVKDSQSSSTFDFSGPIP